MKEKKSPAEIINSFDKSENIQLLFLVFIKNNYSISTSYEAIKIFLQGKEINEFMKKSKSVQ